jgi:hypothetical protein
VIRNKRGEVLTEEAMDEVGMACAMVMVGMGEGLSEESEEDADKIPSLALALIVSYLSIHHEVPRERAMDVAELLINEYFKHLGEK